MLTKVTRLATLLLLLAVTACEGSTHTEVAPPPPTWFGRTRGSAVVLSRDERVAVVANRSAGVVTVFELDPDKPFDQLVQRRSELDMGAGSEPWAAVIGGDDDTAYVISRYDQTVTRIVDLHTEPRLDSSLAVGSEPTAIAIDPRGVRLYVANWGDGTISVITTPDFVARDSLDLNAALVRTGVLGEIEPQPGLAHPRALAFTDDGDDDVSDETLYATEFFSMPRLDAGSDVVPGYFDTNRQGFVYPIPIAEGRVGDPIPIAPIPETGLVNALSAKTGCFPNQLYAAAVDGDRLFVTSMCASPEGPLGPVTSGSPGNFQTVMHPVVFVIDTQKNVELPDQRQRLNYELDHRYAEDQAASPRMALIPNDIAFAAPTAPGEQTPHRGCVTAMGADAVFCIDHDGDGNLLEIGSPGNRYIDLAPRGQHAGHLPVGIALSKHRPFGLVVSDNSQTLSVIDLENHAVRMVEDEIEVPHAAEVRDSDANAGRLHFATGLDIWSYKGQAWVSCEGCHPDGLSDGVTWFFSRGPRRTPSTAGSYDRDGERRVLLWTGNIDEIHDVEVIVRSVAGGVGAVVWGYPRSVASNESRIVYDGSQVPPGQHTSTLRNNLNGSVKELLEPPSSADQICSTSTQICDRSPVTDWNQIDAFIQNVRAPRRPSQLDSTQVLRGAELFRAGQCARCHGGENFTLSRVFYKPSAVENGALPYERPLEITAEQLGRLRTETYGVPLELRPLNPPGVNGTATFRSWNPGMRDPVIHLYGKGTEADGGYNSAATHGSDQINCVLRAVGTFPNFASSEDRAGIAPDGSPTIVRELRQDMSTAALGATGFNIPSLIGVAAGAPYFHAGNARSLEELFDPAFAAHHQALAPGFLAETLADRVSQVHDLAAYLLSIDDDKPAEAADTAYDLCHLEPSQAE